MDILPTLIVNNVKIEWTSLGEGLNGDFNSDDPDDIELLRFDVYKKEGNSEHWEAVDDASYCTLVPVNTPLKTLQELLSYLMTEIEPALSNGYSIKKICERLSHISVDWIN